MMWKLIKEANLNNILEPEKAKFKLLVDKQGTLIGNLWNNI